VLKDCWSLAAFHARTVRASFEGELRERQLDEIITLLPPATNLKDFAPDSFHNDAN